MRRIVPVLVLTAVAASAQIRLDALDALAPKAREAVNVNLDAAMLGLVGPILAAQGKQGKQSFNGPDIAAIVAGLNGINVRSLEFDQPNQYRLEDLAPIRSQLTTAAGWNKIVSVTGSETAEIYMRTEQGKVVGLTILAAEPRELTVVSIDGSIDLAALAQLGGSFGIPDLSELPIPDQQKNQQKNQQQKGKEEE